MIVTAPTHWMCGAWGITAWPLILVSPRARGRMREAILVHERVHYAQQRRWAIWGLGVGLLVWWALYLLALPCLWNPWRRRWETEAYRAEHLSDDKITKILRGPPYWLRW